MARPRNLWLQRGGSQAHACDDAATALSTFGGTLLLGGTFGCSANFDFSGGRDYMVNQGGTEAFIMAL